jgi:hypothetical protein
MQTDEDERQASGGDIQDHYDKEFGQLTSPQHYDKTAGVNELRDAELQGFNKSVNDSPVSSGVGLAKAESNPTTDIPGTASESGGVSSSFRSRAGTLLKSRRNQALAAGGTGVIGLGIAGTIFFSGLFPVLRINSFVQTLQDHFFAGSDSAADKATNKLLQTYLVKKVMPGMVTNKCTSTLVSKSCAAASDATNPVGALFNTWKDARLENKLATNQGMEIIRQGNAFYFKSNNLSQRIALGEYTPNNTKTFEDKAYARMSRSDIRTEMTRGLSNETLYQKVKYRLLFGDLIQHKYNIRRCLAACAQRDKFNDSVDAKKLAFKSWLNERIIAPRSEMYSLVLDCALSSFDCTNGDEIGDDGQHTSQFERDLQVRLSEFRARYGESSLDDLYKSSAELREKGVIGFFVGKLLGETAGKLATKGIPVVGWIDLGARLVAGAQNAGPALKKLTYVTMANTAVSTYMLYRTSADEVKAGKTDATILGSIDDSLNASASKDQGGRAGEDSPVLKSISGRPATTTAFSFTPSVSAAASVGPYKCDDLKPLGGQTLACPEESVGAESTVGTGARYLSNLANSPMYATAGFTADIWLKTGGALLDFVGTGLGWLTNAISTALLPQGWQDKIAEISKAIITTVVENVVVNPVTDKVSGARLVQVSAIGADIAGNDYLHYGLGGRVGSAAEVASLQAEQQKAKAAEFNRQPLFARLFSTDMPQSFLSRVAVATPTSFSTAGTTLSSVFSNPFTNLMNGFAAFLPSHNASAAPSADPFGVTQYVITDTDIAKMGDPEDYVKANCTDMAAANKAWGEQAVESEDTGMFENNTVNGCLFWQGAVGMAGGKYNESLIQTSDTSPVTAGTGTATTGPIDKATVFQDSSNIPCAAGTNDLGIQDGYHDGVKVPIRICGVPGLPSTSSESTGGFGVKNANGLGIVNSRVSANVLAMMQAAAKDGVKMAADSTFRTQSHQVQLCEGNGACRQGTYTLVAQPGYSNHQMGVAIDFSEPGNKNSNAQDCTSRVRDTSSAQWRWLNENAAKYGFKQYSAESWHWDALVATNRCGGDGS